MLKMEHAGRRAAAAVGGDTLRNNGGGLEMARMFERGINSPRWWWTEGVQTEGRTAE